ncbi:MAG: PDZ domain-containing protein [Planctomycetota bacterium]
MSSFPRRALLGAACLLVLVPVVLAGEARVRYHIAFPNALQHQAEVTATFSGIPKDQPLEIRMSRTSPGRYALHEFSKNVFSVSIQDGAGKALRYERPDLHQWTVTGHDGTVRMDYTLFGDRADGTYVGIDNTHAHLNIPATFVWARGLEEAPIEVRFEPFRPEWQVATQLQPTDDPYVYRAPSLAYFIDSPTELSDFGLRTFEVPSGEGTQTIRLAVHHDGSEEDLDAFFEMVKPVVLEQIAIFGEPPTYDFGTYTFIACYLPWVDGDGMEHRNSTILTSTRSLDGGGAMGNLGTVSHEYFHQWNVERIRPKTLEPFDLEAANVSGELWFAEGFTSYYTPLAIRRAGLIDDDEYASRISGTVNTVLTSPGRLYYSPVEMSRQAPFVDAARSVDPTNRSNTFISYYTWGAAIGLALDLELRTRFEGLDLDGWFRKLWTEFGKPEIPYTLEMLERSLGEYTRDKEFASGFFADFIRGQQVPEYARLLGAAGFDVMQRRPDERWLGARLREGREGMTLTSDPSAGSPLYRAGLGSGDRILRLGNEEIEDEEALEEMLEELDFGEKIHVHYFKRGEYREADLEIVPDPSVRVEARPVEELTPEQASLRARWLGTQRKG